MTLEEALKRLEWKAQDLKKFSDDGRYMGLRSELSSGTCYELGVEILQEIAAIKEALAQPEQEPVAWETFALKFANGKGLSYEKPKNLPKYLACRPLIYAPVPTSDTSEKRVDEMAKQRHEPEPVAWTDEDTPENKAYRRGFGHGHKLMQETAELMFASALPDSLSKEANDAIEAMLKTYHYPCNTQNAGRAGWQAARKYLSDTHPPVPYVVEPRTAQPKEQEQESINSLIDEIVALREAVFTVLEGFTFPSDVRNILETAYFNTTNVKRNPLTENHIKKSVGADEDYWATSKLWIVSIARAIEAAHGIKEIK